MRKLHVTNFDQAKFNQFIFDNNVLGFFKEPIRLKSGRMSNWYVNWRGVTNDTYRINELSDFVLAFVRDNVLDPDCYYGVPEGATKLAVITQFKLAGDEGPVGLPLPMGRGKPKEHGKPEDRFFLGAPVGRTLVLEDVTTTGGSLLSTLDVLGAMYETVKIVAAVGLTNRMEVRDDKRSVRQAVENRDVQYLAMSNALELLPMACKKMNPGMKITRAIEAEFEQYGVEKLKLR